MSETNAIVEQVQDWLEAVVIGLNLCPFAKTVFERESIRYRVSESLEISNLMLELHEEISLLESSAQIETTLIIIPHQLADFEAFNQSLEAVDALLEHYGWLGEFQIASFHPLYQFADTSLNDRENWSNRSPYPMLHILRESSVAQAVARYPNPEQIPQRNILTLNALDNRQFEVLFGARLVDSK